MTADHVRERTPLAHVREPTLLDHLRAVTRPAHDRLEGALGLLDAQLGLTEYKHALERFYGFWRGWQPHVASLLQDDALMNPRRRLHLLAADLAALGSLASDIEALPVCPHPTLSGAAEALGSLYVMEGSTLGGRVIERNVSRCLGLGGGRGCSYFVGYGAETGLMWRSFLMRLEDEPASNTGLIANGAIATFERVAWWFSAAQSNRRA